MAVLAYNGSQTSSDITLGQLVWENAANSYATSATTAWRTTVTNISNSTGKWYFDSTDGGSQFLVGLANASCATNNYLGNDANGCSFQDSSSTPLNISGTTGWTGCAIGDRIGLAVDTGNKKLWVRKNGGAWLSGDPVAGTGGGSYTVSGAVFPANSLNAGSGGNFTSCDISGSSHSFSAAVPSGYTQWGDASSYATPTQTFDTVRTTAVTLSNGNLTASYTVNTNDWISYTGSLLIQSTTPDTYFEVTVTAADVSTGSLVGIVSPLAPIEGELGFTTNTAGAMYDNAGNIYVAGTTETSSSTWTTGDVICVAVSPSTNKLWLRKNGGSWVGGTSPNPTTHTGGYDVTTIFAHQKAVLPAVTGYHATAVYVLNAGATTFAFTNPFPPPAAGGVFFSSIT